jgi:hypothetical protein
MEWKGTVVEFGPAHHLGLSALADWYLDAVIPHEGGVGFAPPLALSIG